MTLNKLATDKLILALDGMDKLEVNELIGKLPDLLWVKVGLELFVSDGPEIVRTLRDQGKKVFLDLKFHDIPTTIAKACFQAGRTGAELISIHSCAGTKALKLANQAAIQGALQVDSPPPTLLAITVLTSWASNIFDQEIKTKHNLQDRVNYLAHLAFSSGIGGCVCSPLEVQNLRKLYPKSFQLITPGIRLLGTNNDDQSRVMTPSQAIRNGASRLVIGREITKSSDPLFVFQSICQEICN